MTVCESHAIPGGAAHAWQQDGYHFESGPSLYSGMDSQGRSANPMSHVLQVDLCVRLTGTPGSHLMAGQSE